MKDTKKYLSDKTVTNLLYVLAIIVIVSVITVTVAAFASRSNVKKPITTTTTSPVRTTSTTTGKKPTTTTTTTTKKPQDPPKVTTQQGENNPPDTDVSNDPIEIMMPVDGQFGKGHDTESLSYSMTMNDYRTHAGIDISAAEGSPVIAGQDGVVKALYKDWLMGQCIEIDHGNGIVSIYKNLSEELPEGIVEGAKVKQGDTLGAVGSTAIIEQADEPHLHFELEIEGTSVDPLEYIQYTEDTLAPSYEDE